MSDQKPGMGGLFVNKKAGSSASAASAPAGSKPKNVKQRWVMIGAAAIGFIVLSSTFMQRNDKPVRVEKKQEGMVSVSPTGVEEKDWRKLSGEQLRGLENDNQKLAGQVENLAAELKRLKEKEAKEKDVKKDEPAPPSNIVPPPVMGSTKGQSTAAQVPPPPPVPPTSMTTPSRVAIPAPQGVPQIEAPMLPVVSEPQIFKPEPKPQAAVAATTVAADQVKAQTKYKKNPYNGFLPAGAFAPVTLLNGLDAGTSTSTQANPMPVLMNINEHATLPGAAKYSLKSCFVLGTGYGDMSAERVYVRFSRLSCIDRGDRLVLSADVSGYLVDSDGKIGLRGKVVDRQGAKLGKAMLAGFAQGLSGAFGQAQSTVTSTVAGTATSIGGDAALRAAGLTGAQSAAQQLAQFYLKEAQAMFPVISIDTGRNGTIVFTDNAALTWSSGEAQYVKETRPTE